MIRSMVLVRRGKGRRIIHGSPVNSCSTPTTHKRPKSQALALSISDLSRTIHEKKNESKGTHDHQERT